MTKIKFQQLEPKSSYVVSQLPFNPSFQTDVNPFLVGTVMQMDFVHRHQYVKSSQKGMDVSMKMCAIVLEFANRIMHRCCHLHRSWYHFHRWSFRKIRREHSCKSRFLKVHIIFVLLPGALSVSCSWRAAVGSGDTKVVGAEWNHIKSVLEIASRI